jgi:hypothetical protein
MSYSVTKLISEAFYTSGIVSRGFQNVQGDQVQTGLIKLNEILSDTEIETDMIPYFTANYDFFAVPSNEVYFIPNLAQLETLTFFIGSVRYQMRDIAQDKYYGSARTQNINTLPFNWHSEKCPNGTNIWIYFTPDQKYPMQATGRFTLAQVNLMQDLSSPVATANLGAFTTTGAGTITQGMLVINRIDLMGTYTMVSQLITQINAIVPGVTAVLLDNQVILSSSTGNNITLSTVGGASATNNISFINFSLLGIPLSQTFMNLQLGQYYINYLQYRLAERLCVAYNFEVTPSLQASLAKYLQMISKKSSPIDMNINKISTLDDRNFINYAQVNIGQGYTI